MLNEPASTINDRRPHPPVDETGSPLQPADSRLEAVRAAVMGVMAIQAERSPESLRPEEVQGGGILLMIREPKLLLRFDGRLITGSEAAFDRLDTQFAPLNLTPVFREASGVQSIYVIDGRAVPGPQNPMWNLILFIATVVSVLYVGTLLAINQIAHENVILANLVNRNFQNNMLSEISRGIPYASAILLILGAHELGHYFAARRRRMAVSLPYFLPFPFGSFGTLGAFIQLRQPMKNRKALLEVGAAGPLAGLIFAIPILLYGLSTSPVVPIGPGYVEGNSILYAISKWLVFGEWLPSARADVLVNQLAWAGWTGLFVTGLNLIPIGQLDGGHVLYSLIGERAKLLYLPAIAALAALTFLTSGGLLFMLILLILLGRVHAIPLDNITPLDSRRRMFAIFTLAIFVLVFVPIPLSYNQPGTSLFGANNPALAVIAAVVIVAARRLRR